MLGASNQILGNFAVVNQSLLMAATAWRNASSASRAPYVRSFGDKTLSNSEHRLSRNFLRPTKQPAADRHSRAVPVFLLTSVSPPYAVDVIAVPRPTAIANIFAWRTECQRNFRQGHFRVCHIIALARSTRR
jgi:hypothetical protein